jgi:hypothetical protein
MSYFVKPEQWFAWVQVGALGCVTGLHIPSRRISAQNKTIL